MNARDEAFAEGARLLEDAACDADWTGTPDFCAGLRAGAELLLANTEEATAAAATATPDEKFFVPGRVYTRTLRTGIHLRFVCVSLTSDPKIGDREAWGWVLRSNGTRCRDFLFDHDYPLWTLTDGSDA